MKFWKDMFLAALRVHTNTSPVDAWIAMYCGAGWKPLQRLKVITVGGIPMGQLPSDHTLMSG